MDHMRRIRDKVYRLSVQYSPKLGLDLPYFIKGGFWLGIGQTFNILKYFLLSTLFANILSKEVFGQYTFAITILGAASVFSLLGIPNALVHASALKKDGTLKKCIQIVFKWSILASIFLILVGVYGTYSNRTSGATLFFILSVLFPFHSTSTLYIPFLEGKKLFKKRVFYTSILSIISLIVIGLTTYFTKSVFWIVISTVTVNAVVNLIFTFDSRKFVKNDKISNKDLNFGKKTSPFLAFNTLANLTDNLIIAYFIGFEELAVFTIITLIPNQLKTLTNTFRPLFLPKLTEHTNITYKSLMNQYKKLMVLSIILIISYTIFAPIFFKLFYPIYFEFVILSILFNLSFITFPTVILNANFVRLNKSKIMNTTNIISSTYLILGSIILIPVFGIVGAIANRITYRILNASIGLLLNHNYYSHSK